MRISKTGCTRRQAALGLPVTLAVPAWAQEWTPTRLVTILAGFAPGGSAGQIARQLSFAAKGIVPVPAVMANRAGAAGAIRREIVAAYDLIGKAVAA